MASSNNLATIEPWMFRSTIADSWYPDPFARETEFALTKALQQSFFNNPKSSSFLVKQIDYCSSASTVTASGSVSEPETPGSGPRGTNLGVTIIGKPAKRKSRASKRSMTTFIQADPANFRQMVQQITGVKIQGNGVVKPEPLRQPYINKLQGLSPTLEDTSAYLLHHHQIPVVSSGSTATSQLPPQGDGGGGVDFYSFSSFPTLESSF